MLTTLFHPKEFRCCFCFFDCRRFSTVFTELIWMSCNPFIMTRSSRDLSVQVPSPSTVYWFPNDRINILCCCGIFLHEGKYPILVGLIIDSNFLQEQILVSQLQILLILKARCIASCVLRAVAMLKYLICLSAGFLWLFSKETHSHLLCLTDSTCTCQTDTALSWLTNDSHWHRLNLLTDGRHTGL